MPTATPTPYISRPTARPALDGFDLQFFAEGLRKLYNRLPESASGDRHNGAYVSLVLEVARKPKPEADPKEAIPAKDFAAYFLERSSAYSTTKAGISALLFETWLVRQGGELFAIFLETVLLSETEYLAIFTGEINDTDLARLGDKISEFASFEVSVRAGDRDYTRGIISDVTMLACKADKTVVDPAKQDPNTPTEFGGAQRIESLLPSTRDEYARVVEDGGLTSGAVPIVFGRDPFGSARFERGQLAITDPNDVVWLSADEGRHWTPDLTSLRTETKPAVRETRTPVRETTTAPVAPKPAVRETLCERSAAGALRSHYGSWAVFEAPVARGSSATVVVVRDRAWAVNESLADVTAALGRIEQTYEGLQPEFDFMAEAFLAEYAEDQGSEVSNPATLQVVLESTSRTLAERDGLVRQRAVERLLAEGLPIAPAPVKKPNPFAKKDDAEGGADGTDDENGDASTPPITPPPPPEPEATNDHMDEPPFYREDLQGFYDLQITTGLSTSDALARVRARFKVKGLLVTPAGEVRAPGVIDRPKAGGSPPPPPPAVAAEPPPPAEPEIATGGPVTGQQAAPAAPGSPKAPPPGKRPQEAAQPALGRPARLAEAAPIDQQLQLQTVDDAFMYWLVYEDGDMDGFGEWLDHFCPHLSTALEVWQPSDAPLVEGRLQALAETHARRTKSKVSRREKRQLTTEDMERYDRWKRLVNMPARTLRRYLTSESFREAAAGPRTKTDDLRLGMEASRRTLAMKATPVEEWSGEMWNWCGRQIHFISRLRGTPAPLIEQGRVTRKYLTLKAWGHDPAVPGVISEAEVIVRQRVTKTNVWTCPHCREDIHEKGLFYGRKDEHGEFMSADESETAQWFHRACKGQLELPRPNDEALRATNRLIDALPGYGPRALVVDEREAPDFDVLKRNRTKLSDEERERVMEAGAVWHRGQKGEKTPAVWKAAVGETTWFVTNTHRLFRAHPTLEGAIRAYHRVVKQTA